jgi:REP element-mobilizing transposase RayT
MTRAWRIEFKGALYHVLSRGNERRYIVVDDEDRNLFLDTVGEMSQRFEVDICAYVLMDNHYHLLIRTRRANLSRSMQWLGATYTRRFNSIPKRSNGFGRICVTASFWGRNNLYRISRSVTCRIYRMAKYPNSVS